MLFSEQALAFRGSCRHACLQKDRLCQSRMKGVHTQDIQACSSCYQQLPGELVRRCRNIATAASPEFQV